MTSEPSTDRPLVRRLTRWEWLGIGLLASMAYLPALGSSPGRMPADSKLYLYLDPGRFLGDAASSFDPRQFAGWVPHQHVAYLWPAGPYYWLLGALGVPDWVAHRLWIGSLLFAAGTGMWWCARRFGFRGVSVIAGAVVYQWAIYILPYVSRTSVMLLPWAGLGWVLGLTIQATRQRSDMVATTVGAPAAAMAASSTADRLGRRALWRYPALIALVVFTIGSVNATALAMITPAPILWLLYWSFGVRDRWRSAFGIAARTALCSTAVSVWWIAMLMIQGRFGAEVLPFSETLRDVSFTSTAPEVWRGLGYWLFYIRDFAGPTTSASYTYLVSGFAIVVSFAVPLIGISGLAFTDWAERRFAWLLVGSGGILAVGVYPYESMSPLMRVVTGNGSSGLALALRSSTRAVPVMMVGLCLGVVALCDAVPRRLADQPPDRLKDRLPDRLGDGWGRLPVRAVVAAVVIGIVIANAPSLRRRQLVDPMLERSEQPPAEWLDAAAAISGADAATGRVLQVPGIEFGAYRWGFTVDQPLPGLADKPLVTRDLLPLGSAAAMDVLYALDDRVQAGTATTEQFQAAARLLGVDTIWLTGDLAFDRFETARPIDIQRTVEALGDTTQFGEPRINTPRIVWADERSVAEPQTPIAPVELVDLDQPSTIVRGAAGLVAVSGSGDGLVASAPVAEAATLGSIVYTADRGSDPLGDVDALVITDSNRNRNRQWRSSHDPTGATLTATDPVSSLERSQRLPVFENQSTDAQTIAVQDGPVTAFADRYGEPFGFQPEHRAAMAIDGDESTAWTVGEHGDPNGATIVLNPSTEVDRLELSQYLPLPDQRHISRIRVSWPDDMSVTLPDPPYGIPGGEIVVDLDRDGTAGSNTVQLPVSTRMPLTIEILAVAGGTPLTEGIVADVGFREIVLSGPGGTLTPTTEWIRTPIDAIAAIDDQLGVAYSLQRDRVDPLNPWRSDPEPALRRIIDVGATATFDVDVELRLDGAIDDRTLTDLLGGDAWATTRLGGSLASRGAAAHDGDPNTAWVSAFDGAQGAQLSIGDVAQPLDAITIAQPNAGLSQITGVSLRSGGAEHNLRVVPDGDGIARLALDPPLPPGELSITVTEIEPATTIDRRFGDLRQLPVSISEIALNDTPGRPESVPTPSDCVDVLRIDERVVRARLVPAATVLDDRLVEFAPCDDSATVPLDAGEHRIESVAPDGIDVDAVDLRNERFVDAVASPPPAVTATATGSRFRRSVDLSGCDRGCWLVFGEGYNRGWTASVEGRGLGAPTLVDGTANGWWIEPELATGGAVSVEVVWNEQRPLELALVFSLLAVLACIVLAFASGPAPPGTPLPRAAFRLPGLDRLTRSQAIWLAVAIAATVVVVAGIEAAWIGVVVATIVALTRRRVALIIAPPALLAITALIVTRTETAQRFTPDALWPRQFPGANAFGIAAFALCLVIGLVPTGVKPKAVVDGD